MKKLSNTNSEQYQLRYLPQSVRLEEETTPQLIKYTMLTISLAVLFFIAWSAITKIDQVAHAGGQVVPKTSTIKIQHQDGGTITELAIKDGDVVKKGQLLLKIDDGSSKQDLATLNANLLTLQLQAERLSANIDGRMPDFSKLQNVTKEMIAEQKNVLSSDVIAKADERSILQEQLKQKANDFKMLLARKGTVDKRYSIARQENDISNRLQMTGNISRTRLLATQKQMATLEGEVDQVNSDITNAKAAIEEFQNRLSTLDSKNRSELLNQLDSVNSQIAQSIDRIKKIQQKTERLNMYSSIDGIVKGLKVTSGSVIAPGEQLMEIIPDDGEYMAEVRIDPKDIGFIRNGQNVRIKVSSYDFSRFGAVTGKLESISATTFNDEQANRIYYLARISLDQKYVGLESNKIFSGMMLEADIITGNRTILQYLLKPINNSIAYALTEK